MQFCLDANSIISFFLFALLLLSSYGQSHMRTYLNYFNCPDKDVTAREAVPCLLIQLPGPIVCLASRQDVSSTAVMRFRNVPFISSAHLNLGMISIIWMFMLLEIEKCIQSFNFCIRLINLFIVQVVTSSSWWNEQLEGRQTSALNSSLRRLIEWPLPGAFRSLTSSDASSDSPTHLPTPTWRHCLH